MANMTPEERTAEKLRLRKLQEEADLKMGLETLGLAASSSSAIAEALPNPTTKEEFAAYAESVSKTIKQLKDKEEYAPFLEELVYKLCTGCELIQIIRQLNLKFSFYALVSSINIRKIKTSLDNLCLEQQKIEKGDKPKKKAAGKGKIKLRIEGDVSILIVRTKFES